MPAGSAPYSFRSQYRPQAFYLPAVPSSETAAMLPYRCFLMRRPRHSIHYKRKGEKEYPVPEGNYHSNTGIRYKGLLFFSGVYCLFFPILTIPHRSAYILKPQSLYFPLSAVYQTCHLKPQLHPADSLQTEAPMQPGKHLFHAEATDTLRVDLPTCRRGQAP